MDRPYVDYAFYTGEFYGTKIPEASFPYWANKASRRLDTVTFGRMGRWERSELPSAAFDACCAIAEIMYDCDQREASLLAATGNGTVKSESNDGYSISYADISRSDIKADADKDIRCQVVEYLGHTGLLFRGKSKVWDV